MVRARPSRGGTFGLMRVSCRSYGTPGGVLLLWTAMRGPGALPSGRAFVANFVIGWGVFNMLEALARHDLGHEWLVFATGMGFALLGAILLWTRPEPHFIERRTGDDRRSGSPVR